MLRLRQWIHREEGMAAALLAACLPLFVGLGALVTDVAHGYVEKRQLQNAVDAAALAASAYLPTNDPFVLSQARSAAIDYAARNGVTLASNDVTFTANSTMYDTISVHTQSSVAFNFAPAIGVSAGTVRSQSSAQLGVTTGAVGVMPWGMTAPAGGFRFGQSYCLKLGSNGGGALCSTVNPSNFQAIDIDNDGTNSGNVYRDEISSGSHTIVRAGQVKAIVTGNMTGPTQQGTGCTGSTGRIAGNHQTFDDVISHDQPLPHDGDDYGGTSIHFEVKDWHSPRLILVPVIETVNSSSVRVTGFSVFFIENCGSNGAVIGRFIDTVIPGGIWGPYNATGDFGSRSVRLVS